MAGLDFLLRKKSSVPRGSKENKLAYFLYSLTRPVEPTVHILLDIPKNEDPLGS